MTTKTNAEREKRVKDGLEAYRQFQKKIQI